MTKYFFIMIIASTMFFVNCSDDRYTEKGIEKIVQKTDSLLTNLAGQKYEWASKSAYSTILAYYPTTDIIFLNENLVNRSYSEAFNFYYFKDGTLIRYKNKMLDYLRSDAGKLKKRLQNLTINFDPDGDVISYERRMNGKNVSLGNDEIETILSHSKELYKIAGDQED